MIAKAGCQFGLAADGLTAMPQRIVQERPAHEVVALRADRYDRKQRLYGTVVLTDY